MSAGLDFFDGQDLEHIDGALNILHAVIDFIDALEALEGVALTFKQLGQLLLNILLLNLLDLFQAFFHALDGLRQIFDILAAGLDLGLDFADLVLDRFDFISYLIGPSSLVSFTSKSWLIASISSLSIMIVSPPLWFIIPDLEMVCNYGRKLFTVEK